MRVQAISSRCVYKSVQVPAGHEFELEKESHFDPNTMLALGTEKPEADDFVPADTASGKWKHKNPVEEAKRLQKKLFAKPGKKAKEVEDQVPLGQVGGTLPKPAATAPPIPPVEMPEVEDVAPPAPKAKAKAKAKAAPKG